VTAAAGSFITAAIRDAAPTLPYSEKRLLTVTTQFVNWCVASDLKLSRDELFIEPVIAEFTRNGIERLPKAETDVAGTLPELSDASKGNARAMLRRVAEVLVPTEHIPVRLAAADPRTPYLSNREIDRLRRWAAIQDDEDRLDAELLLALGLGTGLTAGEIGALRYEDVTVDAHGVRVRVSSGKGRVVPVLAEWEDVIVRAVAARAPGQFMFVADRAGTPKNLYWNFIDHSKQKAGPRPPRRKDGTGPRPTPGKNSLGPNSQRGRATWLLHHLEAGTRVDVLMAMAGLQALDGLSRYVQYMRPSTVSTSARGPHLSNGRSVSSVAAA
jgi:integrase